MDNDKVKKGLGELLAGSNPGKGKKQRNSPKGKEEKIYIPQIWGKASVKKLMDEIQMEVEYRTRKENGDPGFKYTYGDMLEEAMELLAEKKGIDR